MERQRNMSELDELDDIQMRALAGLMGKGKENLVDTIDQILTERGKNYGSFKNHAEITQRLKLVMSQTPNWNRLTHDQKESLEMQVHKIGRILNGDPNYIDSWDDIAGYAKLVADILRGVER